MTTSVNRGRKSCNPRSYRRIHSYHNAVGTYQDSLLDRFDRIYVQGVATNQLSYSAVSHQSNLGETLSGIGIYGSGVLEAVYVGDDLSLGQLKLMTQGII